MVICKMGRKKNTLLYLNTDIVRKAKSRGINLSEVSEKAIQLKLEEEESKWFYKSVFT